jgi:hypothetical protein
METDLVFDLLTFDKCLVHFGLKFNLGFGCPYRFGGGSKCVLKSMFWHCVVTNGGGKQGFGIP